ncbi:FAD-dependent oxidoreductase [Paenirhodobacter sp.]|uniref:FAD-dependent oxidoreductase n=1 Tax=Paenirhodobacter sp. TaxID=1965326 RepID=UPI003B3D39FE
MTADPRSVAGKSLDISEETEILIVGAGPAGIAAARRARQGGARVLLVDEAPVPFEVMAESLPQLWGMRMGGATRNRTAMTEQILTARPALTELFDEGVDLRLGTACWGLFANQANLGWMPGRVAGLVDPDNGSTLVRFEQAIIATGRRDMGLAFPGWEQPGVMGAGAALALARDYGAFDGRVAVMLGTADEALLAVLGLLEAGVAVAAVIEQAEQPVGSAALLGRVVAAGVPVLCAQAPRGVRADIHGVTGLRLRDREIACDTILLGIGAVPMIDLVQAAGARCVFSAARGGFVPQTGTSGETSLPGIRVAGDCCGIWGAKSADPGIAAAEGRIAAEAALGTAPEPWPAPPPGPDIGAYRKEWVRAAVIEALSDVQICQCEEVTAREILEVRPPRYLAVPPCPAPRSLTEILGDGPPQPDQIKRLTRAGMGPCQGRRCREQIQALLAIAERLDLGAVPLAGYRSPVRPVALSTLAPGAEDPAIAAQWDSWFGMPRQWVPFWEVEEKYTVAALATERAHVSE